MRRLAILFVLLLAGCGGYGGGESARERYDADKEAPRPSIIPYVQGAPLESPPEPPGFVVEEDAPPQPPFYLPDSP
jgi:hypothetical protein